MNRTPASHNTPRKSFLGVREGAGFPCRGTRAGRPGDGGGEKTRWLKLKREEVEESGPRSLALYEPARRRLRRGGVWVVRSISPGSRWVEVISIRGGDMRKEVLWRSHDKNGRKGVPALTKRKLPSLHQDMNGERCRRGGAL